MNAIRPLNRPDKSLTNSVRRFKSHAGSLEQKHEHARESLEHCRISVRDQREQEHRREEHEVQELQELQVALRHANETLFTQGAIEP